MISPKIRTKVTLKTMAIISGTILSRNNGKDSRAAALQSKRVTSIQWWWSITEKILLLLRFASGSLYESISSARRSIEARPTVMPDIKDETMTQMATISISIHQPSEKAASSSLSPTDSGIMRS